MSITVTKPGLSVVSSGACSPRTVKYPSAPGTVTERASVLSDEVFGRYDFDFDAFGHIRFRLS